MKPARVFRAAAALVALGVCVVNVTGCKSSPTAPSGSAVYSQSDLRVGTGATAGATSVITVDYNAWFYDATQPNQKGVLFDSTTGGTPATFTLGTSSVIAGWEQGVVGMKEGGLRRLVVPPTLAYGTTRYGPIPPNTTLVFEIELLVVNVAPTVTTQPTDQTVAAGQTATFFAEATGAPTPTVQWQGSTDGGTTWSNVTNTAPYDGATTTTLRVIAVTTSLNGFQYRAVFTTGAGSVTSTSATLTVQ